MDIITFAVPFLILKLLMSVAAIYVMILVIKALRKYLKNKDN